MRSRPFVYKKPIAATDIELSEEMFIIPKDRADEYVAGGSTPKPPEPLVEPNPTGPDTSGQQPEKSGDDGRRGHDTSPPPEIAGFTWTGDVSPQKWMNFYTKVLSKFATGAGLRLTVTVEVVPSGGLASTKVEETRNALRELGLAETITIKGR